MLQVTVLPRVPAPAPLSTAPRRTNRLHRRIHCRAATSGDWHDEFSALDDRRTETLPIPQVTGRRRIVLVNVYLIIFNVNTRNNSTFTSDCFFALHPK